MEEPILPFLMKTYRSGKDGLLINPGLPSRYFLEKEDMLELLVAYTVAKLSQMEGAWIPTKNNNMLLVEHKKKKFTVAIYSEREDAQLMCKHSGGIPKLHSWESVFNKAKKVGATSLFLHFNLPDQYYLSDDHVDIIWKGKHKGYQEKEPVSHLFIGESIESVESFRPNEQLPKGKIEKLQDNPSTPVATKETEAKASTTKEPVFTPFEEQITPDFSPFDTSESIMKPEKEPTVVESEKSDQNLKNRQNPYSLKSQKQNDLDIYIGGKTQSNHMKSVSEEVEEQKKGDLLAEHLETVEKPVETPEIVPNLGLAENIVNGLEKLEKATVEGQGMANGWEVCQVLAEISRIWVIVDADGNMVILAGQDQSPIVDFFSSDIHAKQLIAEAHKSNPNLPTMHAQLVSTKKLYRALAPRQPIVWINRGSSTAWTSVMGDTLPYVMQLMSQLQK